MKNKQVTSLLLERLERIPTDSIWAHKASGLRGSLLQALENLEKGEAVDPYMLERLHSFGFLIVEKAAREKLRRSGQVMTKVEPTSFPNSQQSAKRSFGTKSSNAKN